MRHTSLHTPRCLTRLHTLGVVLASAALAACVTNPSTPTATSSPGATAATASASGAPACERLPTMSNTNKVLVGAAVGTAAGALIGHSVGGNRSNNAVKGALGGALVGALAGSAFKNDIDVEEQSDGSVRLKIPGRLMFASGQYALSSGFQSTLGSVSTTLKKYCGVTVRVVGHTDSQGAAGANQALSEQRARAVQGFMKDQGFEPARISFEGRGQNEPVASNADDVGRQQNRRVEIFVRPPAS